ncbi:hypothetical protein PHYSODRAFT_294990 [Phytophthora sojae]|uniref:Uncharacterized protein n=1 Tax=Phytophthora sojae (strain P6497) TaxID=1094619 RepID=G4YQG8_PHYSP|nr:hypothetical protein PHYSODRAFT_470209 [Phytophthora sojae]XP_009517368.1 hypothetical protein PHYSODRAFT_294990 [Phytophthora sojae]EGZ30092.1 hypothetical protein PHYSODRAFT_470209 [Phytophthora sojae]EGZ30093.1 hypothetical protein PHYSODRAFT_294990 [Phytophthora sojae]|eukprot:XP_009517367.1 hypothetical protein PHYSODRAFT_470209 [Phytophthora sojae]
MLPKLTQKRGVKFVPTEIEPAFVTARRNALLELKSIDAIRISCFGKGSSYTIEVFADSPHSRLTTNTTSTTSSASTDAPTTQDGACSRRPTVRIESDLGEFVDLRDKVYNSMFEAHYKGYCKFCLRVLGVVVEGVDPGGVFFTLFGQDRVVRKLTKFMEDLLARTVGHASANTQGCCSAQILVPQIVHAFLFTPQPPTASEAA